MLWYKEIAVMDDIPRNGEVIIMDINSISNGSSSSSSTVGAVPVIHQSEDRQIKAETTGSTYQGTQNTQGQKSNDADQKVIDDAVQKANKLMVNNNTHLQFSVHKVTHDIMVKIVNDNTGEVIKEIPSEKILDMIAKMWQISGLFVNEKR